MYLLTDNLDFSAACSKALCSAGVSRKAIKWLERSLAGFFGLPIFGIVYV
jgi:hypothetical protein